MTFDSSINIGVLIALVGLIFKLTLMHRENVSKMATMSQKVDMLYRWFERHIILGGRKASFRDESEG